MCRSAALGTRFSDGFGEYGNSTGRHEGRPLQIRLKLLTFILIAPTDSLFRHALPGHLAGDFFCLLGNFIKTDSCMLRGRMSTMCGQKRGSPSDKHILTYLKCILYRLFNMDNGR